MNAIEKGAALAPILTRREHYELVTNALLEHRAADCDHLIFDYRIYPDFVVLRSHEAELIERAVSAVSEKQNFLLTNSARGGGNPLLSSAGFLAGVTEKDEAA